MAVVAVVAASIVGVRAITNSGETAEKIQVLDDSGGTFTPSEGENSNGGSGPSIPPSEDENSNGGSGPSIPPSEDGEFETPAPTEAPEPEPTPTQSQPTEQTTTQPVPGPTQSQPTEQTTTQPVPGPQPTPTIPIAPVTTPQPIEAGPVENRCDYSYNDDDWYTLENSGIQRIDFRGRDYRNCDLSGAVLNFADFSDSDLSGANLSGAALSSGFFNNAKLIEADLSGAILNGVDFSGADLTGANLSGSTRIYASFANAVTTGCTDCTPTVPSSGGSGQEEAEITEVRRLTTPTVACSSDGNDVKASWNEVPEAAEYSVLLQVDRQRYLPGDLRVVTSSTSHAFNGMDWEVSYEILVFALTSGEDPSVMDSGAGKATCTTGANPVGSGSPRRLPAPSIDCSPGGDDFQLSGTYDLSWTAIPGADEYFVTYQEEGDAVIIPGGWQPHSTVGMGWANPSTEYTISVQAFRDGSRTVIAAGEVGTAKCSFDSEN
ncbi:pentapeptide repeat-containing protein [Candidatus Poriferisocius sp.]|uniref:pentapeptide repeat-containing protein n=1 Tax=Candidatus Poriferisocius sp. TaxID=3101276 RepID=UPI003B029E0B